MKLHENPTSVSRSDTCGRTDMTVLNSSFVPNSVQFSFSLLERSVNSLVFKYNNTIIIFEGLSYYSNVQTQTINITFLHFEVMPFT